MNDPNHPIWSVIRQLMLVVLFACGAFMFADSPDMTEVKLGAFLLASNAITEKLTHRKTTDE